MSVLCAILLGLAIVVTQTMHGGLFVAALSAPGQVLVVAAGIFALVAMIRGEGLRAVPGALLSVAVFLGYLAWRCWHAPDAFLGRAEMGQVLACGLVFFVTAGALTSVRAKYVLLGIVGAAALAQAVLGFLQFVHKEDVIPIAWFSLDLKAIYSARFLNRAHGFFMNPNQFAWLETWAALFAVALACWGRMTVLARVILVYLAMVFVAMVVLSSSRGGVVALAGGLAAFAVTSVVVVAATLRRGRVAVIAGAVLLLSACLAVGGWVYASNWVSQGRTDAELARDVRVLYYSEALRSFQTAPLLGTGPEMFRYAARSYRLGLYLEEANDPIFVHSDWLQTLAEYGFIGFVMAAVALGILLIGGARRFFAVVRDRAASDARPFSNSGAILLGAFSAAVAFAIHSAVDFNMHVPANALLAAATFGLLAGGIPAGLTMQEGERRIRAMLLRVVTGCAVLVLGVGLGAFVWRHAYPDFQNLRARNAFASGNMREALSAAEAGLGCEPGNAGLLEMRGKALYAMESAIFLEEDSGRVDEDADPAELPPEKRSALYRDAAHAFSQALEKQPLERQYHIELAKALVEDGRIAEAHAHFIEAIRLDPAQEYAYGAYGDQLDEEGLLPRALRIFELGAQMPLAKYCAERADDVREELTPLPADDTQPPSAEDEEPSGDENSDEAGAQEQ